LSTRPSGKIQVYDNENTVNVIGVDIGGTKIAAGRVNDRAEIFQSHTIPTRASEGFDVSIQQVWRAIEPLLSPEIEAIGMCAPGPLDPRTGVIVNPPNLPGWRDVPLVKLARDRFGLPVRLENDCNAAGLAEARFGAARGFANVFFAAIGTGIGAGIILDGKIYHGKNGAAGEAGHMTIDYRSSTICGCGVPGCIEALASGRFTGDLEEHATRLAAWLGGIVSLLDPDIVVLGGGVAEIGDPLLEKLRAMVPKWTINPYAKATPIVPAQFGTQAGVVGAAAVALANSTMNL
jgi:glucokinase